MPVDRQIQILLHGDLTMEEGQDILAGMVPQKVAVVVVALGEDSARLTVAILLEVSLIVPQDLQAIRLLLHHLLWDRLR